MLALGVAVAGVALPLVRRRLKLPAAVTAAAVGAAPIGMAIATRRSFKRDAVVYVMQMWAFIVIHELPNDDPERLIARTHVDYPIEVDRRLFGQSANVAVQRKFGRPGRTRGMDVFLTAVHWAWFFQPHASVAWVRWRHPEQFDRAATQMAATFDIGMLIYFLVPTAPPWWAAERGRLPAVRRLMVEVGERIWGRAWNSMYGFLGGNPVAAMPSLHFGSSVMAARVLGDVDPRAGAIGWAYALTLGFALVYLGEHYLVDLAAGYALTEAIRAATPAAGPRLALAGGAVRMLEARAHA